MTLLNRLKDTKIAQKLHNIPIDKIMVKKAFLMLFFGLTLIALALAVGTYIYFAKDIRDKEIIMNKSNTGLVLLDDKNEPFFAFYNAKATTYVSLDQVPKHTQQAVIASEDREFYKHPGFSLRGILRAFRTNMQHRSIREGGSTISQELMKIALLTHDRTLMRKYQELVLSIELTRLYTKDEILEMYLNSVYFGEGAFGIQNAAQTYFAKDSKDLTIAESALLISLLPAPSALSPVSNDSEPAFKRQRYVIAAMLQEGMITQEQADAAINEKIVFNTKPDDINNIAPHFAVYVKDQLVRQYGEEIVIRSGYRVKTTLNSNWQKVAEKTVEDQVQKLKANKASNASVVVLDPKTGEIKVMVGSHNWYDEQNGKINMAVTPRQPGSSFKPLIYSKALADQSITAATILQDNPKTFADGYKPQNYDKRYRGPVTVRRALANSLNIPAIEVMERVGVNKGVSYASEFELSNLKQPSNYGLSLVLGSAEVSLLEMTSAYSTFANKGVWEEPIAIFEVIDKYDNQIYKSHNNSKRVLDEGSAFIISSILSDNNARAEIFGNALTINRPAAVKTGTSENYRDSLTIGYTPSLVVGVWVGNNDSTSMDNVAGSIGAAPIWRTLMQNYLSNTPIESFSMPSSVVKAQVCYIKSADSDKDSDNEDDDEDDKKKSSEISKYDEYFLKGTEKSACNDFYLKQLEEEVEKSKEENDDDDNDEKDREDKDDEDNDDDDKKKKSDSSVTQPITNVPSQPVESSSSAN